MATRFTIAIPTHNRRETVLLAAQSALAQTRPPEQIIVLCDGCDDGTAEAVRSLGSPLTDAVELPKAPGYAYGHRNRSLELARGEVILWQNTSWLARMADPARLDQMRLTLKASALGAELEGVRAELAVAQQELTAVRRDLAMARLERATATYRAQELGGRLARAETQAGAHAETLRRIYAGRWWRLRGVLVGLRRRLR